MRRVLLFCSVVLFSGNAYSQGLPPPPGPLDFGYYKVIDKDDDSGTSLGETACYTNSFRTGKDDFASAPDWPAKVEGALFAAVGAGKPIILSLDLEKTGQHPAPTDRGNIETVFNLARPVWNAVRYIELTDEPDWQGGGGAAMINERIALVEEVLAAMQLPRPPMGIGAVYTWSDVPPGENKITNSRLDWVGMEAYLTGDTGNPATNTANVEQRMIDIRDRTGNKPVNVVMQAYDYFGPWNMANLADVQRQTYRYSVEKLGGRLVAITMFAYNRSNGTRSQPLMIGAHKQIAGAIGILACGGGGSAPAPPTNLAATAQLFTVTLTWSDNSGNEAGFRVQRRDPGTGAWTQVGSVGANVTTFQNTVPAVPAGGSAAYTYRVRAFNGIGDSGPAEASITLYGERPPVPAAIGPQGCITTVTPTLTWIPAARATSYYVAATRADFEQFFINDSSVTGTSYPVSTILQMRVAYRWKVKACNNMGCSTFAELNFTPFCGGAASSITAPLGCIATSTPTFTWLPVTGAYQYWLLVATSPDFSATPSIINEHLTGTSLPTPGGVSFTAGATYYAKVKTILNPGSTTVAEWSPTVSFTPFCGAGVNQATYVSQTAPASMTAGRTYAVSVTMQNTGTSVWTAADAYRLGSQNPQDNLVWGLGRVELPAVVGPGASGVFRFDVRAPSTPGTYNFQWRMVRDAFEWFGVTAPNVVVTVAPALPAAWKADYDGDGRTDHSVWRPSDGSWSIVNSATGVATNQAWGTRLDVIVPGDYDGDRKADLAVWRPSEGNWYVRSSGNGATGVSQWGGVAGDVPVPGDYDGDGRTDLAVWRRFDGATGSAWHVVGSRNGAVTIWSWGVPTDIPVPGDYDGDGRADFAVWRPSEGRWYVVTSSTGQIWTPQWGAAGDIPVPADYDGDGRTDLAVWRQGTWLVLRSQTGQPETTGWGAPGDVPVPGDYDGDRKADRAVWRLGTTPNNNVGAISAQGDGTWYVLRSSTLGTSVFTWGAIHDVPTPKAR